MVVGKIWSEEEEGLCLYLFKKSTAQGGGGGIDS